MHRLRRILSGVATLVLPSPLARVALRLLGHRIASGCRLGWSMVVADQIELRHGAVIGHLNLINIDALTMEEGASIGRQNILNGPFEVVLKCRAAIGNTNKMLRGPLGRVTSGHSALELGELTKITANHRVDCTQSVRLGNYSILAGAGSQVWTHGYVHDIEGPGRYRIDGSVTIGDNVYIGAGCIISLGVRITSAAIVGAGTTIARNLDEPGLWVSSAIRHMPRPAHPDERADLIQVMDERLCERVYLKKI